MDPSPAPLPTSRIVEPSMRVNALYQMALGVSMKDRSMGDLRLTLGTVRDGVYQPSLRFANGELTLAIAVARGELDVAAVNPSAFLSMAYRGTGPYPEPLPLRVIAVMPSLDVMLFAVAERTGIRSFADIRDRRYPLRVSVRGSASHGTRFVTDQVLAANGFSLKEIESWGGSVHYAAGPFDEQRIDGMRDGSVEAIFDEGVRGWAPLAMQHGMRFLDLDERSRARLVEVNWAAVPARMGLPEIPEVILAPSFSGWPLFTREDLAEPLVYGMCQALEEAGGRMAWDSETPVSLADVCRNTDAAPFDVPLHPGAERYYRERGYLK
jgi:TRAP-type uncharacterized transport system substrate-binding protein